MQIRALPMSSQIRMIPYILALLLWIPKPSFALSTEVNKAISDSDAQRLRQLLADGKPHCEAIEGHQTCLMRAAELARSAEVVSVLLSAKPDVSRQDYSGKSALMYAASNPYGKDRIKIAKMLIEAGADVNARTNGEGISALYLAVSNGDTEMVRLLLRSGAEVKTRSPQKTPILVAAVGSKPREGNDDLVIIRILLTAGASINEPDDRGVTPLMLAAELGKHGEPDIVRFLIKRGAKVNFRNADGNTALSHLDSVDIGTEGDHSEVIRILKAAGAKR